MRSNRLPPELPVDMVNYILKFANSEELAIWERTSKETAQFAKHAQEQLLSHTFYIPVYIKDNDNLEDYTPSKLAKILKEHHLNKGSVLYAKPVQASNDALALSKTGSRRFVIVKLKTDKRVLPELQKTSYVKYINNNYPLHISSENLRLVTDNDDNNYVPVDERLHAIQLAAYYSHQAYSSKSKSFISRLSFWNGYHGDNGQLRADNFLKSMNACATYPEALTLLKNHLNREEGYFKNKGRLNQHSFDTLLLNQIAQSGLLAQEYKIQQMNDCRNTKDGRATLRDTIIKHAP